MTKAPLRVTYYFAPQDAILSKPLEAHLSSLKRKRIIATWSPEKIVPGQEVALETYSRTVESDIIIMLLSADFLNCCENFIDLIYSLRLVRKFIIIPVILRPGDYSGYWFSKLKALPPIDPACNQTTGLYTPISQWKNEDMAWTVVADGIRESAALFDKPLELVRRKIIEEGKQEGVLDFLAERPDILKRMFSAHEFDEYNSPLIRPKFDGTTMDAIFYPEKIERTFEICRCNILTFLSPKIINEDILKTEILKLIEWDKIIKKNIKTIKQWMKISYQPIFKFIIVNGRRENLKNVETERLSSKRKNSITIRSYDWILEAFDNNST